MATNSLGPKFSRWLMFGVLAALVPFMFTAIQLWFSSQNIEWASLTGRGELLLVAAAICATAIGELIGASKKLLILKLLVGGVCGILLMLASLTFAWVASQVTTGQALDINKIALVSVLVYSVSVLAGGVVTVSADN